MFSSAEFERIAGRRFNSNTYFIGIMNASWGDSNTVPYGVIYQSSDGIIYANRSLAPATHVERMAAEGLAVELKLRITYVNPSVTTPVTVAVNLIRPSSLRL